MNLTGESVTFTELKQYAKKTYDLGEERENDRFYALLNLINNTVKKVDKINLPIEENIILESTFQFRAQNSYNRTGYGSEYSGGDLVYEGTLYGETTTYIISGIRLSL